MGLEINVLSIFILKENLRERNDFGKSITGLKSFAQKFLDHFSFCDQILSHPENFVTLLRPSFSTLLLVLALNNLPIKASSQSENIIKNTIQKHN